jgi:simple sugar transport system substrate-binding protein
MKRNGKTAFAGIVAAMLLTATACSEQGGAQEEAGGGGGGAGQADTPRMTVAMVTHAAPGDTFWDILQKGAQAAADKDNVEFNYSSDPDSTKQANLVQGAIDSKVDGIAVTLSAPEAIAPVVQRAVQAGIPVVAVNQGFEAWKPSGALSYFGSNEAVAGEEAGKRAVQAGAKHVLCTPQAQGSLALETRCSGVEKGVTGAGARYTKVYTNELDLPGSKSTLSAQLTQDRSIDYLITLGAPMALVALDAIKESGSSAKLATFDSNPQILDPVRNGEVQFLIDQQPYLQGYLAVDSLWLYKTNGNIIGGGLPVATGPAFVDQKNIDQFAEFAEGGTR